MRKCALAVLDDDWIVLVNDQIVPNLLVYGRKSVDHLFLYVGTPDDMCEKHFRIADAISLSIDVQHPDHGYAQVANPSRQVVDGRYDLARRRYFARYVRQTERVLHVDDNQRRCAGIELGKPLNCAQPLEDAVTDMLTAGAILLFVEYRRDKQLIFSAHVTWVLFADGNGFVIITKRVDFLNSD